MSTSHAEIIPFQPRARLLRLIGGELVSDEIVAVMELVKNAYDADATRVDVTFTNVMGEGQGEILIEDDGHGMDMATLIGCWMQPGGSTKQGDNNRVSRGGRRLLGEKGIGRFAADKLGNALELVTRARNAPEELRASIDWAAFETEHRMLSAVTARWERRTPVIPDRYGTALKISGLRTTWSERLFRKLCMRLARLRSPFEAADSFRIVMHSDDFPDYSGEILTNYLPRAPYQLEASFDGGQSITIKIQGEAPREMVWNGSGALACGAVAVRLFAFDLETPAIAKVGPNRDVRAWLKEWTGVSIYRDSFRVWPYGEPHDDWLRLDQRRVNNPTVCLSNNQIIGFVEIGRQTNPELVDQTNREGIIQSRAFDDLRRLVHFVLQQLEQDRLTRRHHVDRRPEPRQSPAQASIVDKLTELVGHLPKVQGREAQSLVREVRQHVEREEGNYKAFVSGYSELAAVGQAVPGILGAIDPLLRDVQREVDLLRKLLAGQKGTAVTKSLRTIADGCTGIEKRLQVLAPMQSNHSVRRRAIDVVETLKALVKHFAPLLDERSVNLNIEEPEGLARAEIRPENLYRVLHILITNSLDWLQGTSSPRITIAVSTTEADCMLLVSDNGPGIPEEFHSKVFEPMFTGREGARGMGLTIAQNIVRSCSGDITVVNDRRRKGATLRITLPRKRSRVMG